MSAVAAAPPAPRSLLVRTTVVLGLVFVVLFGALVLAMRPLLAAAFEDRSSATVRDHAARFGDAAPEARAAAEIASLPAATDAVWLPPSVTDSDADTIARAMKGRGVALVGSRRGHLDAGCAVVVRSDPRDLGGLAAVLAQRLLGGADAAKFPVRRARRRLVEVNLPAARRLEFRAPLSLLAAADTIVRTKSVVR